MEAWTPRWPRYVLRQLTDGHPMSLPLHSCDVRQRAASRIVGDFEHQSEGNGGSLYTPRPEVAVQAHWSKATRDVCRYGFGRLPAVRPTPDGSCPSPQAGRWPRQCRPEICLCPPVHRRLPTCRRANRSAGRAPAGRLRAVQLHGKRKRLARFASEHDVPVADVGYVTLRRVRRKRAALRLHLVAIPVEGDGDGAGGQAASLMRLRAPSAAISPRRRSERPSASR